MSLRAAAYGVRVPDGIMAAYPATMLQSTASPSRLLSIMDPLLPLSVLTKCVSAYAGKTTTHTAGGLGEGLDAGVLQGRGPAPSLPGLGKGNQRLLVPTEAIRHSWVPEGTEA